MNYFIITIDTEGDYIWHTVMRSYGMRNISVENAKYIERFQMLCNKFGFIPTYLVNYEMAHAETFVSLAKEWVRHGKCEIGMHLHAWNTPPIFNFSYRHKAHNPYAGEYPSDILFAKMKYVTKTIEKKFGVRPISHRGGRWYLDKTVVNYLIELGYIVDCSVTPRVSWEQHIGYDRYGSDYSDFPDEIFWISGDFGKILEVPPTIHDVYGEIKISEAWKRLFPFGRKHANMLWLRPRGNNLSDMLRIVERAERRCTYLEFMIHSSELMPGGSPTFRNKIAIEKLYEDLEVLFARISKGYVGVTLGDFAQSNKNKDYPVRNLN